MEKQPDKPLLTGLDEKKKKKYMIKGKNIIKLY